MTQFHPGDRVRHNATGRHAVTNKDTELLASLTGFTPGPHIAVGQGVYALHAHGIGQGANRSSAYVDDPRTLPAELEVNARLYAAAPDLHRIATELALENKRMRDALKSVECWWNGDGNHRDNGAPACIFEVRSVLAAKL